LITIRRRAVDLIPHQDAYNHLNSKPLWIRQENLMNHHLNWRMH